MLSKSRRGVICVTVLVAIAGAGCKKKTAIAPPAIEPLSSLPIAKMHPTIASAKNHTIAIPARFNQIAQYPIAVVKGSRNPALARTFVAYVLSPAGQSVLRRSGFITTGTAGDLWPNHRTRALSATVVGTP